VRRFHLLRLEGDGHGSAAAVAPSAHAACTCARVAPRLAGVCRCSPPPSLVPGRLPDAADAERALSRLACCLSALRLGVFSPRFAPGVCCSGRCVLPPKSAHHHELRRCRTGRVGVRGNRGPTSHAPRAQLCAARRPAERPLAPGAPSHGGRRREPRRPPAPRAHRRCGVGARGSFARPHVAVTPRVGRAAPPRLSLCAVCHRSLLTVVPTTTIAVATPLSGNAAPFPPSFSCPF